MWCLIFFDFEFFFHFAHIFKVVVEYLRIFIRNSPRKPLSIVFSLNTHALTRTDFAFSLVVRLKHSHGIYYTSLYPYEKKFQQRVFRTARKMFNQATILDRRLAELEPTIFFTFIHSHADTNSTARSHGNTHTRAALIYHCCDFFSVRGRCTQISHTLNTVHRKTGQKKNLDSTKFAPFGQHKFDVPGTLRLWVGRWTLFWIFLVTLI